MMHRVGDRVMISIATGADFVGNRVATIVEHSGMSPQWDYSVRCDGLGDAPFRVMESEIWSLEAWAARCMTV